ncbi:glycosyltransferase family 4 protein [Gonapodya prolifera JEL478]|uniref:Glycosyltransferase family 4 protein n=1 Tax=Gonapodya prolifera (strain JEL478) TaxID=1344416 RepID=A0A139APQ1_GONPJ|nr:glycosyltransferase family 4 protein [Gonapodya prolifera JEL478]|eukprot:KXS18483.1 glycosyltransferase family 4 protein [Gonapodya prolifera JEL478]
MRHALMRLFRLLNVNVRWFVMKPKPEVFDITKRRMHNVLQGVAGKDVIFTDEDQTIYEDWCRDNAERYFADGPFVKTDVFVMDDPQVVAMLPIIKKVNPTAKIIFRCHIEVRNDIIKADPESQTAKVWNYLWNFIKDSDLFVFHPVKTFVPDQVPLNRLVYMPAVTDRLDGLNKDLRTEDLFYYHALFNRIAFDQSRKKVAFYERPYIIQIARFDPSKGIPDLVRAYKILRDRMAAEQTEQSKVPQLVLAGHGSVDDPDGTVVFEELRELLSRDEFSGIANDIIAARLFPSDQLLNALVQGAKLATQLSYREGFEIKVTECLIKGKPIICYGAGGIPHQVIQYRNGILVPVDGQGRAGQPALNPMQVPLGRVDIVADWMYRLLMDEELCELYATAAAGSTHSYETFFTVANAVNWLYAAHGVADGTLTRKLDALATNDNLSHRVSDDTASEEARAEIVQAAGPETSEEFFARRKKLSGRASWVQELWYEDYFPGSQWKDLDFGKIFEEADILRRAIHEHPNYMSEQSGMPTNVLQFENERTESEVDIADSDEED